ncbi:MAG: DUF1772 domain-containing protein [Chryseolinea sp.]
MMTRIALFINIVMAGLIAGTLFGIWLGYNPAGFSYSAYVEYQQNAIRSLNTIMPLLGLVTIIITFISARFLRKESNVLLFLLSAALLLIISGLITRFGNQPINAIVMTWNKAVAPTDWKELRDKWWTLHIFRMVASTAAFCLTVMVACKRFERR